MLSPGGGDTMGERDGNTIVTDKFVKKSFADELVGLRKNKALSLIRGMF